MHCKPFFAALARIYTTVVISNTLVSKQVNKRTCSATYLEEPYPFAVATSGLGMGSSGTGLIEASQLRVAEIEEVKKSLTGRSTAQQKSISWRVPETWASNDWRVRLKSTRQALCKTCVTVSRT